MYIHVYSIMSLGKKQSLFANRIIIVRKNATGQFKHGVKIFLKSDNIFHTRIALKVFEFEQKLKRILHTKNRKKSKF